MNKRKSVSKTNVLMVNITTLTATVGSVAYFQDPTMPRMRVFMISANQIKFYPKMEDA